jgi:hypothetical protein
MVILPFPFIPCMGSPSLSSSNSFPVASGYPLRDWSPVPAKPISPATALPREYDNDVGGVLMMLLEPVMVEANVEDTDDEVEEAEANMGFGALAVGTICLESKRESDLLAGRSERGADVDKLANLRAPELRLFAVPLAIFVPEPVNLDRCIWAT